TQDIGKIAETLFGKANVEKLKKNLPARYTTFLIELRRLGDRQSDVVGKLQKNLKETPDTQFGQNTARALRTALLLNDLNKALSEYIKDPNQTTETVFLSAMNPFRLHRGDKNIDLSIRHSIDIVFRRLRMELFNATGNGGYNAAKIALSAKNPEVIKAFENLQNVVVSYIPKITSVTVKKPGVPGAPAPSVSTIDPTTVTPVPTTLTLPQTTTASTVQTGPTGPTIIPVLPASTLFEPAKPISEVDPNDILTVSFKPRLPKTVIGDLAKPEIEKWLDYIEELIDQKQFTDAERELADVAQLKSRSDYSDLFGHEKEYQKLCEEAEKAIGKLEDKGEKARQKADVATFKDALQRISPYDYANLFSFTEAVEDMAKNEYPFYFGSSQDKEDKKVIKALVEAKTDYIDRNTQTVLYLGKLSNIDSVSRKEKTKIFSHFYDESHRCFKRGMYSYAIMALKKAESVYPGSKRVLRMAERIGSAQEELRKVLGEAEKALVDVKKALEKVRVNEDVLANAEIALQNAQEQETNLEKIEKGEINWGEIQKAQRVLEKPRKDLENAKSELGKDKYKATSLLEATKKVLTKLSQRDSSGNLEVKGILATINDYENQLAGNVIVPAGVGLEKPVFASAGNLLTSRPFGYQGRLGDSRLAKLFQSLQGLVGLIAPWASVSKLRLKYGVMEANALFSGRMATEYETDEQVMDDVLAKSAEKDTLILVVNDGKKRNYLHIDLPSLAAKAAKTIPGMENVVNEKGDLPIMTGSVEWQEEEIDSETWLLKPSEDKLSYGIVLPIHLNQAEVGLTLPINKDGKVVPAYMKVLRKGVGGYNKVASDIKIERIIAGRVGSPTDRFRSDKANLDMARAIYSWVNEVFPGNRMAEKGLKKITEEKIRQNISPSLGVISVADFLNKHKFVFTSTSEDIHKEAMNQYNKMTNAKDESEAWLSLANKF
ncbi:MAG: hypothetical protein ABIH85_08370, partial [Candidatus Omnitrophota bacterium]